MTQATLSSNTINIPSFHPLAIVETTDDVSEKSPIVVWFDPKIQSRTDIQDAKTEVGRIIKDVFLYTEYSSCISFIQSRKNDRIFLITSGSYASNIVSSVGNLPQVDRLFIFCMKATRYEQLLLVYPKIIGIYIRFNALCAAIKEQIEITDDDLQTFTFFDPHKQITQYLSKELAEFLCFQLFKHIIHDQSRNEQTKEQMIDLCSFYYRDKPHELTKIDEFERNYQSEQAIQWYSKQSFVYKMINTALRKRNINYLYSFRFFISDLSQSLAREQKKMVTNENTMVFYRGAKLTNNELKNFKKNLNKLVSNNSFLSTSRDRSSALVFAKRPAHRIDTNPVLFEIVCNMEQLGQDIIFADITSVSEFPEENEILFDLSTVFRIENICQEDNVCIIRMNATNEGQTITEDYIREMRLETENLSIKIMLGIVMCGMGQLKNSQQYFEQMLKTDFNEQDRPMIVYYLGQVLEFQGELDAARKYYDEAYEQMINAKSPQTIDSARVLNSIGNLLMYQEQYDQSLDYLQRALQIQETAYPSDHVSTANTLNNIGVILGYQEQFDEALKFHQRALSIQEKFYPTDHVKIAITLNNLGNILSYIDDYDQALKYYQQALAIQKKCYPSDDINLATTYNSIGTVFFCQRNYYEALEYHQHALDIQRKFHAKGHMDIANTLNSIAAIRRAQKKYDDALVILQQVLKIKEELYPDRHLDIATSLNNIGLIYEDMNDFNRAIEYHKKSLWLKQSLPTNQLASIATSYTNLASVYTRKNQHDLALEYGQKCLEIREKILPKDSRIIGDLLTNIGYNYENLSTPNPQTALKYYKQALAIQEKHFPPNHPVRQRLERYIKRLSNAQSKCILQ